jgi:hypothetical protein
MNAAMPASAVAATSQRPHSARPNAGSVTKTKMPCSPEMSGQRLGRQVRLPDRDAEPDQVSTATAAKTKRRMGHVLRGKRRSGRARAKPEAK